jgi:hypothetical protein
VNETEDRRAEAIQLPEPGPAALHEKPCIRFHDFLPRRIAEDLRTELSEGLEYERVQLGEATRHWRALRPLGDVYFGYMVRREGWATPATVAAGLELFESREFVHWLSMLAGEQLAFLRPPTAYKLTRGDRICLHDDMSGPGHAVSVAYNLSANWDPAWGGTTLFGEVESVTPLETPPDSPIELCEWRVRDEQGFVPTFNSLLVMKLGFEYAHGVAEVLGDESRHALVGIYGRVTSDSPDLW